MHEDLSVFCNSLALFTAMGYILRVEQVESNFVVTVGPASGPAQYRDRWSTLEDCDLLLRRFVVQSASHLSDKLELIF